MNGSGVAGLEDKERAALQNSIFNIKFVGTAPPGQYFNQIYLYDLTNKPATKERLETYYNTKSIDSDYLPDGIDITDLDFVIILGVGYTVD